MKIECRHIAELPFNLNLPSGPYEVRVGAATITLHVLQERIAAHLGPEDQSNFFLISRAHLAEGRHGQQTVFHQRLRTVIELGQEIEIPDAQIPIPTVEEERAEMVRQLIIAKVGLSGAELEARAVDEIAIQEQAQAAEFRSKLAAKLTAKRRAPSRVADFLKALNALVRLYMARFNDFFVEEVAIFQLTGMVTSGVMMVWWVNGKVIDQVVHVEKLPGTMRGQWFDYGEIAVAEFRDSLRNGVLPASVSLLSVRARGFLERGAYRSAIIEASAALETIVTRRIRDGLIAAGRTDGEVFALLKSNERFKDRAKKLLKAATGVSAASLDAKLWQLVLADRENYRHRIAHSDLEPNKADAKKAVEHFTKLAALVSSIP